MPKKERLNKMAQVKPTQKKKMSRPALAALIVSIVLVVAMIVSLVASSGLFTRIKKGAYTENFEVNGSMLAYYTASYYQNWYYNNYYYILLGYINFDASKPLSEQYTDSSKTTTYLDQFTSGTKNYVEQVPARQLLPIRRASITTPLRLRLRSTQSPPSSPLRRAHVIIAWILLPTFATTSARRSARTILRRLSFSSTSHPIMLTLSTKGSTTA